LGQAYIALEQNALARDILNQGLAAYPNERELYREIANTYRLEEDLAAADNWYARLLQRWAFDAYSWAARGEIALLRGEPRQAMNYFREALKYRADGLGYWLGLATSAELAGNEQTATEAYTQALALGPQEVSTWLRAGRFFAENGRVEQARTAFIGALNLQPDNQEAAGLLAALPAALP
jgi:tetratricopeptide (TPR) repeat protein